MSLIYRLVLYASLALAVLVVTSMTMGFLKPSVDLSIADKDFANYWIAGRLIQDGKVLDLFGPHPAYFAHLKAAFGPEFQWHNWSYPPHYLLLIWPLGLFDYKSAALLFLGSTAVAFVVAYRAFIGERSLLAWVAVFPLLILNFWCVQNGYLSSALALGALALRDKRPIVAGVLLAMLTIKPQLGILFPFLLIAERRWLMIISTVAATVAFFAVSAAVFGIEAWRGYLSEVLPYQTSVMTNLGGLFLDMLPSSYGALRNIGAGASLALAVHWLIALPTATISIWALFRVADARDRAAILLIATFIVTPYALNYDLASFEAAVALLAMKDARTEPSHWIRKFLFSLAMLLPVLMMFLGLVKITIAPPVMLAIWWVALKQAGFAFRNGNSSVEKRRSIHSVSTAG